MSERNYELALEAIRDIFESDQPKDTTEGELEGLRDEIEIFLEALKP